MTDRSKCKSRQREDDRVTQPAGNLKIAPPDRPGHEFRAPPTAAMSRRIDSFVERRARVRRRGKDVGGQVPRVEHDAITLEKTSESVDDRLSRLSYRTMAVLRPRHGRDGLTQSCHGASSTVDRAFMHADDTNRIDPTF